MYGVDDPDSAPGEAALDGLRKFEARVHPRCRVNEPGVQMLYSPGREFFLVGDLVRARKVPEVTRESQEELPVSDKIVGVRQSIALNVRPSRVFRVGPPIVTFR